MNVDRKHRDESPICKAGRSVQMCVRMVREKEGVRDGNPIWEEIPEADVQPIQTI